MRANVLRSPVSPRAGGLGAGRKLKTRRREQLWHDKGAFLVMEFSPWLSPLLRALTRAQSVSRRILPCAPGQRVEEALRRLQPQRACPASLTACTPLRTHAYACAYAFLRAVCAARLRVLFVLRLTEGHRAGEDVRARCARSRRMRCPSGQPPLALLLLSASALAARNGCAHRHGHPATAGRRSSVPRAPLLYGRREAAAVSDQGSGLGHRRRRRTSALAAHARCRSQAPGRRSCLPKAALRAASALRAARVRVSVISAAPRPTYHGPGDRAAPPHAAF